MTQITDEHFTRAVEAFEVEKDRWRIASASGEGFFAWRQIVIEDVSLAVENVAEEGSGPHWFTTEADAEEFILHRALEAALAEPRLPCGQVWNVVLFWGAVAVGLIGLAVAIWIGARQ